MSTRSPFSKFSLKPSSLSQHTANFNKILEEVPAPKIDQIILEKPKLGHTIKSVEIKADLAAPEIVENKKESDTAQVEAPAPSFVFGQQIKDRVVNAVSSDEEEKTHTTNGNGKKEGNEQLSQSEVAPKPIFGSVDTETEKFNASSLETDDANTLIRMNCKLFVLEKNQKDQSNWSERGYGVLKMIDSADGINCKIMMWTDKIYRLILNTKLFEAMHMERVHRKSISLNGQDEGTLKNFLIKCGNPNECEELFTKMYLRLKNYREKIAIIGKSETAASKECKKEEKQMVYKCACELKTNETSKNVKVNLYNNSKFSNTPNSQRLFIEILDATNDDTQILSNQYLKSIKLDKTLLEKQDESRLLEFEIKESFSKIHKVTIKDSVSIEKFLQYYEDEMKSTNVDTSCDSVNETDTDDEGEESEQSSLRKSDHSHSLESSTNEGENTEKDGTIENQVEGVSDSKKRKQEDVDNSSAKKASSNEEDLVSLKRGASSSSQESNEDKSEKSFKKTKVTEDEIF